MIIKSIADRERLGYVGRKPGSAAARPLPTVADLPAEWRAGLERVGLPVVFGKVDPGFPCVLVCPNATDTRWWHRLCREGYLHALPTGRIKGLTRGCGFWLCSHDLGHKDAFASEFHAFALLEL